MNTQPYSLQTQTLAPMFTCTYNCSVFTEMPDAVKIRLFARSNLKNVEVVIEQHVAAPSGFEQSTIDATLLSMEEQLNWYVNAFPGLT